MSVSTIQTTQFERTNLEAHVDLCAERYRVLEEKVNNIETRLDGIEKSVIQMREDGIREFGRLREDMIKAQKAAFDAYVKSKWALTRYQDSKSEWRGTIQNVIGANYYYNDMKHFAGSLKRFMQ